MAATPEALRAPAIDLAPMRALCELIANGAARTRSGSISVTLDRADRFGVELLRAAHRIASEFGLRHRIQLAAGLGTIHVWREGRR